MKMTKIIAAAAALTLAGTAFAADPIVGNWQMSENCQPKAVVKISESGGKFTGVVVSGQTEKAKKFVGKTVIIDAQNLGGGKYKGKAKDPRWGVIPAVNADITLNGNKLTLKTLKGSQTLTRK